MGNIVSNNGALIQNTDKTYTQLSSIIQDWAINNYDGGLNYNNPNNQITNLLKKRACCTGQVTKNIALPNVNINSNTINSIAPIDIQVFTSDADFATQCNLLDDSQNRMISYYPGRQADSNRTANASCSAIYECKNDPTNPFGCNGQQTYHYGLCNQVYKDRKLNYGDISVQSYGQNIDDTQNPYSDCNCQNSVLRILVKEKLVSAGNSESLTPDIEQLVQSLDGRCVETYYIPYVDKLNSLCLNYNNSDGANTVENNSNIKITQTCSTNQNFPIPGNNQPTTTSTTSTTNAINLFKEHILIILLIIVSIGATVFGGLVIGGVIII
jgi:hypothetical protein